MKLLVPRARGGSVWACVGSFGGGFVAGDETSLDVRVGAHARCFLTRRLRPRFTAIRVVAPAVTLCAPNWVKAPCWCRRPTQSKLSPVRFISNARNFICDLAPTSFCSTGSAPAARPAEERWCFTRLQSRNEVFLDRERLLLDSMLLDQAHGALDGANRMGRFNCLALIAMTGPIVAEAAASMLAEVETLPVTRRAKLIVSASPIRHGALLRVAGEQGEEVGREVRRHLAFVRELLGDDPWARKW